MSSMSSMSSKQCSPAGRVCDEEILASRPYQFPWPHPTMPGPIMNHNSTQPPTQSNPPAHVDPYAHNRHTGNAPAHVDPYGDNRHTGNAPSNVDPYAHSRHTGASAPNYTLSSAPHHQPNFSSYAQPSSSHSPANNGPLPRGLGSLSNQTGHPSMAPPGPYRSYHQPYPQLPTMSGPVMSNIHQPGSQLSMIAGMVPQGYGQPHPMMYTHTQPQPQTERPFKCDQCVQSFSRNHDLKRHKRIHLAVKPFPCTFCSKSFSRKDALKRHRLVKGCESKANDNPANMDPNMDDGNHSNRNGETEDDGSGLRKTP